MRDDFGFEKESRERSFVDCDALGDRSRRGVELFHLATCIALPGSRIVEHSVGENRLDRAHLGAPSARAGSERLGFSIYPVIAR